MSEEETINILKNMSDGYTFKDCEVCDYYNSKTSCCDKNKCNNLKAIQTAIQLLEQKDNKIKELNKGINALSESKNKWKNRYYKDRIKLNKIKSKLKNDIKENEYTEFAIRGAWDFRNSGKLVEAKEILRILEE